MDTNNSIRETIYETEKKEYQVYREDLLSPIGSIIQPISPGFNGYPIDFNAGVTKFQLPYFIGFFNQSFDSGVDTNTIITSVDTNDLTFKYSTNEIIVPYSGIYTLYFTINTIPGTNLKNTQTSLTNNNNILYYVEDTFTQDTGQTCHGSFINRLLAGDRIKLSYRQTNGVAGSEVSTGYLALYKIAP